MSGKVMAAFYPSLSNRLSVLTGWRRLLVAFLLGLASALAFPPFQIIPLLWLCFPALVFLLRGAQGSFVAFGIGWSFAFGQLVLSLSWISGALFVDIKSFWWVLPLALAGLPACFAIYYGFAALLSHKWGIRRTEGPFFFALCWFGAEMARAHLFTGFPWDILGYVWGDVLPVMQSVSLWGIEGLTLLTLLVVVTPTVFLSIEHKKQNNILVGGGLFLFVLIGIGGGLRLAAAPQDMVPDVRLRLVQPHIDQALKWKTEQRIAHFMNIMSLTFSEAGQKPITHYIWPETATSYYLAEEPDVRSRIAASLPDNTVLITGVVRRQSVGEGMRRYYNSLIALDSSGSVIAGYDKYHLVPFGEYMPYRSVISVPLVSMMGTDFTAGDGIRTTRAPRLPPFSPLICYEAIFSGDVVERADPPAFLLNITNDGWYRGTIGPSQHFSIARARAIEEGMPLVRVANSGVTAVVDGYGRTLARTEATGAGYVDSDLPKPVQVTPFFGKYHPIPLVFVVFLSLVGLAVKRYK